MKLKDVLAQRVSNNDYDKNVISWLDNKTEEIIRDASAHLEYVRNVLVEFDLHNAKHSEAVLKIVEELLGEHANDLSSYDLFSLIAVSYLHDCGMAVSDFEINVMQLIENDEYDGKKVCTKDQALALIEKNKAIVFKSKNDVKDVKEWLFYPGSEEKLFDYYSQLLIDYQSFRNGKIDRINKDDDCEKTNNELRTDYIRRTHAERVETYIRFLGETRFSNFPNKSLGKRLANRIAMTCKAHCEKDDYVRSKLEKKVMYLGGETSNLQFVAMMLRIGDIVHFSYDRAPSELRAMHHFESDYSHRQWQIKSDSGVNYSISKNGEISYSAYCNTPQDYYDLMKYVDGIDNELVLYNRLRNEEQWEDVYPGLMKYKVNRDNIAHDDSFIPVPNLKFTLEQNRILDLLMGVQLYSDEYACLRELYQNSLDACRCQIAIDKSCGKDSIGKIEFGIETDKEGNSYVYCLDNGKGMSEYIIENYLLKIGSSYYKSFDFYQSQAATGNTFTPTSQFGIGILSCFMIGDKIEITTRELGSKYISCVMENIHECFYYKTDLSDRDMGLLPSSGTLIKIFLNDKYKNRITDKYLNNIGYLLWKKEHSYSSDFNGFLDDNYDFSNHLYFILNGFVRMVQTDIELSVKLDNGETFRIFNKPQPMGKGRFVFPNIKNLDRIRNKVERKVYLDLDVEDEGIRCRTNIILPTNEDLSRCNAEDVSFGRFSCCVDGIIVGNDFVQGSLLGVLLPDHNESIPCIINFTGPERPQLSVSREKIVNFRKDKYNDKMRGLLDKLIKQAIDKTVSHIVEFCIQPDSELYKGIWDAFFDRFKKVPAFLIAQYFMDNPIKDLIIPLPKEFTTSKITFGSFMGERVCFKDYQLFSSNSQIVSVKQMHSLIVHRIYSSKEVSWDGINVSIEGYQPNNNTINKYIPLSGGLFDDYDIVSCLYPFVSISLFESSIDSHRYEDLWDLADDYLNMDNEELEDLMISKLAPEDRKKWKEEGRQEEKSNPNMFNVISELLNQLRFIVLDDYRDFRDLNNIVITVFNNNISYPKDVADCGIANEGMSIILIGNEDCYFIPGRWSRQELVDKIPDDVWKGLIQREYRFTDGTVVTRS